MWTQQFHHSELERLQEWTTEYDQYYSKPAYSRGIFNLQKIYLK